MQIQIKLQTIINAPASKVWAVLAHDFADIGRWATSIPASRPSEAVTKLDGAVISGRVCSTSVPGIGDVREDFISYDEKSMRFSYAATDGMPSFVKRAVNNWEVRSLGSNQSVVEARGELHMNLIPCMFFGLPMKFHLNRTAAQLAEELKYYIENGRPHPQKLKATSS